MIDDIIRDAAQNKFGIPIFDFDAWQELCAEYKTEGELHPGLNTILPAIHRHIHSTRPPLPITRPTERDMENAFRAIQSVKVSDYIKMAPEVVLNKFKEEVEVSSMITATHTHNAVSGHWHNEHRYKCAHASAPSTHEVWHSEDWEGSFRGMFLYLWRVFGTERSPIDENKYKSMFRLSGYVATQFKPLVARIVYDSNEAKRVVDISCGWGDRLAGFYCSRAEEYVGCDPNKACYELYKEQCKAYEEVLSTPLFPVDIKFEDHGDWFEITGNKRVRIFNRPAEDIDWDSVLVDKHDMMFTSPPYFGIERYAEGQPDEDKQSWKRYSEYDEWRDTFFYPVMDAMKKHCEKLLINIVDPVVGNKRYRIEDDIRNRYGISDVIGMRMSRRPSPSGSKNSAFVVDGKALNFIEPIYVVE